MKLSRSFVVSALIVVATYAQAQDTHRTLFIGNSYIYVNDVDQMYANIATSAGKSNRPETKRITPGGYRLAGHAKDVAKAGSALNKAITDSRGWDFVVLQDQSQTPGLASPAAQKASRDGAKQIASFVKDSDATIVLYMTWARRDAPGTKATDRVAFSKMQNSLARGYKEIASNVNALGLEVKVAPVGRAFESALDLFGTEFLRSLYMPDGSHPSESGAYMAACVIYATAHNSNPTKIKWKPEGMSADQVSKILYSAKVAVYEMRKGPKNNLGCTLP